MVWLVYKTGERDIKVMVVNQYDLSEADAKFAIATLGPGHAMLSYRLGRLSDALMENNIRMP